MRFEPHENNVLNGIVKYLYDANKDYYDANPEAFQNTLFADGTKAYVTWGDPWVTIYPYYIGNTETCWCSPPNPYAYIAYHFVNYFVKITHYGLRSRSIENVDMPIGWILFGSNDNSTWQVVDEQQNRSELIEIDQIYTYQVKHVGVFKHFKLICTENTRKDQHVFSFGKIDFYGELLERYSSYLAYNLRLFPSRIFTLVLFCA